MNSNDQPNNDTILKSLTCIMATILIVTMFLLKNNSYIQIKNTKTVFNENISYKIDKDNTESELSEDNQQNILETFKDIIINNFNIEVNGYAISINDYTYGYVSSIEDRQSILNDICQNYINELDINTEDIIQISVLGKIEATPNKIHLSELKQSGEIATEIYNASLLNEDLLGLQIKVKVEEHGEVEPTTVIEPTEELYMGYSETVEGIKGESIVSKEITYNGFEKVQENIINEKIVKPAVSTVIKKGTKNPYYDNVVFLKSPTIGGCITSHYGEVRNTSTHSGVDIAKNLGDDVIAALDGKVIMAGYNNGGYGNLIVIEHGNNIETYYAHLSEIYVSTGDNVEKGDVIGAIGSTGYSTGPHLHFELRVDGSRVNPMNYIIEE